jgi:hypothetical protein
MAGTFTAEVDAWVRKSERRMTAVFRQAADLTISAVYDRTPVVVGFLRASLTVNLTGPVPMNRTGGTVGIPSYSLVIAGAKLGDTIYASFAAVYARRIEYGFVGQDSLGRTYNQSGRRMVGHAVQNWQHYVDQAVREARARVKN